MNYSWRQFSIDFYYDDKLIRINNSIRKASDVNFYNLTLRI
jgi:hypothetical protein